MRIEGYVRATYTTTVAAGDAAFSFKVVPAAFPLNQSFFICIFNN